jgi:hypothetical protein
MEGRAASQRPAHSSHWLWVLCLVGLDYFSSLAYQPSIAFEAAGVAAPLATVAVVLVTLLAALPTYAYVAGRSPHGQGAIGLLERTVHGWTGKFLVLVLLGFAGTDFVITKTLSVADAATHIIYNPEPHWQGVLDTLSRAGGEARDLVAYQWWKRLLGYWNKQLVVTIVLSILGFSFWWVFRHGLTRRVVRVGAVVVAVYLLLSAVVVGSGLTFLATHPAYLSAWWGNVTAASGSGWALFGRCLRAFPSMSLGLSGFELSMVVLPLLPGDPGGEAGPGSRARSARKLLGTAAAIMALYLLGATLVTTVLLPPEALRTDGRAANRALAYVAHGGALVDGGGANQLNPLFGEGFGTLYDISSILILSLAGASVTLGLRHLVPQYLHRLGMELAWAHNIGAIIHVFNCINLTVTLVFRASVTAQRMAYATSVLVLMSSAAAAAALDLWRRQAGSPSQRLPWGYLAAAVFFLASAGAAIRTKPDGLLIALCFVVAIVVTSIVSRALRTTELRFEGFEFKDAESRFLWESLKYLEFPVLVPHRPGRHSLEQKEERIRRRHRLAADVPVVFVQSELGDASDFYHRPLLEAAQEGDRFLLRVTRCASIPHVLAAVALELSQVGKPPEIHFGWSDESPVVANLNFLLFGQGNVPWMVRELIRRAQPDPARRPPVIIG